MRALALILIVLLAAAMWWWSSSAATPAVPGVVPAAVPTAAPAAAPADLPAAAPAAVPVDVTVREPVPVPETGGVLVRVVDAATRDPVPAAAVSWCGHGLGRPPEVDADYAARAIDAEAFHRERGLHGVTDARGEVRVPTDSWFTVTARAGDRYGEAFFLRGTPEVTVELHADSALSLRTVDAASRPVAGVAVRLACAWAEPGKDPVTWRALLPASDERGMTALPHVQELISSRLAARLTQLRFTSPAEWRSATLSACIVNAEGPPVAVDLQHLPPQPVDLVVPADASLEFVLRGPDGAPFPLQPGPHLCAVLVPKGGLSQGLGPGSSQPWNESGRAVFPRVALGERLELLGRTNWYEGMKFDGPTRPGEHLVVEVNMSADAVWITGRLFGEDGRPWTRETMLQMGGGSILPGNPDGRFCVPVPEHVRDDPRAFVDGDGGAVGAEIVLPMPLAAGANDIGTIVLKRPPLLVSGQVVVRDAADGAAMLQTLRARIESWPRGAMMGRADWLPVELDAEGRFAVYALARNTNYEFLVDGNTRGGYRKFEPGTTGLVVEVSPGGSIAASFLVDPAWGYLDVSFARVGAQPDEFVAATMVPCGSGRATADADSLEAGQYRVTASKNAVMLAELLVTVVAGKPCDDPRLRDFDLRNVSKAVRVIVTDELGSPIDAETHVAWRPVGTGDERWSVPRYQHEGGQGMTILSGGALEVCVWAVGHRAVDKAGVSDTVTIALPRLPQVTLRWADAPELPPGVTAQLVWERIENGPSPAATAITDPMRAAAMVQEGRRGGPLPTLLAGGEAKCCAVPGERLRAKLRLRGNYKQSEPIELSPAELHAATFVAGQTIELRADPDAVQAALRKLADK